MTSDHLWERLAYGGYLLILGTWLLVAPFYLAWRGLRQAGYWKGWSERFWGRVLVPNSVSKAFPRLWVHAVSVGETRAIEPLVRGWLSTYPAGSVVLTQTTPTGRQAALSLYSDLLDQRLFLTYLPYDLPWVVHRFLDRVRPQMLLLVETELWPSLIRQCDLWQVPVVLVNGRLSQKSLAGFQRLSLLSRPVLRRMAAILPQTQADAHCYLEAGAPSPVVLAPTGNLKFDIIPDPNAVEVGRVWRSSWPHSAVWLFASSRAGEEDLVLCAFQRLQVSHPKKMAGVLLVIVPRHPERFSAVFSRCQSLGLKVERRSLQAAGLPEKTQVWVGDSLGEMAAYIAAADLVLMGGSLHPYGGQNPIEACAQSRPVFFGPSMFNFSVVAEQLLQAGAAQQVPTAEAFMDLMLEFEQRPDQLVSMGEKGRRVWAENQGASSKTLATVCQLLMAKTASVG